MRSLARSLVGGLECTRLAPIGQRAHPPPRTHRAAADQATRIGIHSRSELITRGVWANLRSADWRTGLADGPSRPHEPEHTRSRRRSQHMRTAKAHDLLRCRRLCRWSLALGRALSDDWPTRADRCVPRLFLSTVTSDQRPSPRRVHPSGIAVCLVSSHTQGRHTSGTRGQAVPLPFKRHPSGPSTRASVHPTALWQVEADARWGTSSSPLGTSLQMQPAPVAHANGPLGG